MTWHCRDFRLELNRTRVMAIVNATPDSFSDGGMYFKPAQAIARVLNCIEEGADVIDLGGESTRPGAEPVSWQEEWSRLEPVLDGLASRKIDVPVSIDTYHPETASRSLAMGASIINCVYEKPAVEMAELARETGCGLVVPFRRMDRTDDDRSIGTGSANGLEAFHGLESQLMIDPMIGFGTTREEDMALMGSIRRMARIAPVLVGVSRKRLIKKLTGAKCLGKNLGGSVGAAVWCAMAGASVVRVHDVKETVQALAVVNALATSDIDGGLQKEVAT